MRAGTSPSQGANRVPKKGYGWSTPRIRVRFRLCHSNLPTVPAIVDRQIQTSILPLGDSRLGGPLGAWRVEVELVLHVVGLGDGETAAGESAIHHGATIFAHASYSTEPVDRRHVGTKVNQI